MAQISSTIVYGFLFVIFLQLPINEATSNNLFHIQRNLGELLDFVCPEYHKGKSSFYHYNSTTEQYQLVYNDSHRFQTSIESLDDAGRYCCSKHHGETLLTNKSHYCVQVAVPTTIQWNLPVFFHGDISGACTLTSNPLPTGDLINIHDCEYQSSVTVIDRYTVTVNFTIYSPSQSCYIYCYTATYQEMKILVITSTAVIDNSTETTNTSSTNHTDTTNTSSANHTDITNTSSANRSTTTTTPTPTTTNNPATSESISSVTTISTNLPTHTTGTTEHRLEDDASTNTDIDMVQNRDSIQIILTLTMVMVFILTIIAVVILILIVWIVMRGQKTPTTKA